MYTVLKPFELEPGKPAEVGASVELDEDRAVTLTRRGIVEPAKAPPASERKAR